MESLGYVTLRQLSENRKNVHVYLKPLGKRRKRKLVPFAQVNAVTLTGLSDADVGTTRRALL